MKKDVAILTVNNVAKRRGRNWVLKDLSFCVQGGSILGLLGPNGAGKTTLMEIISGISHPDRGTVTVDSPTACKQFVHSKFFVGAQLQQTSLHAKGTVLEHLRVFSSFYKKPIPLKPLLEYVKLESKKNVYYMHLSGGEKQRLALALVLVGNPHLILLDEPTTGLDAHMRNELHEMILNLKRAGKTILLCTHYIEEAEKLCDKVAILNKGQMLALDSPAKLKEILPNEEQLEIVVEGEVNEDWFMRLPGVIRANRKGDVYSVWGKTGRNLLEVVMSSLRAEGKQILSSKVVKASLEDVFIRLTGESTMGSASSETDQPLFV